MPHTNRILQRSALFAAAALALGVFSIADALAQQRRAAPAPTRAEPAWYVGAGIGIGDIKVNDADYNQVSGATTSSFNADSSHPIARIFGGYRLHRNLSMELGYGTFGTYGARREFSVPAGAMTTKVKVSGFTFHVVGWLPLSDPLSVFAKVGYFANTIKTDADVTVPGLSAPDVKRNEINLAYGLGLQYDVTRNISLRAEWEQVKNVGNKNDYGLESNITIKSGSAIYRF